MVGFGEGAEERYQASLEELRKNPEESIRILKDVYQKVEETQYFERWKLVETMSAIQDEAALAPLSEIAVTPIPPEKYERVEHAPSSTAQESNIRVTALDGLAYLARDGHEEAEGVLLQSSRDNTDVTVRRRAIRGYLAAGDNYEERATKLKSIVPEEQHNLIHLDVTPISEVPQPPMEGLDENLPRNLDISAAIPWVRMSGFVQSILLPEARAEGDCDWSEDRLDGVEDMEIYYRDQSWCQQPIINAFWNHFGFEYKHWGEGMGYYYPCNLNYPLGRAFIALWVLFSSTPQPPQRVISFINFLEWGYWYAAHEIDHLRIGCTGLDRRAANFGEGEVFLYFYWFGSDIISRPANLIHEARHNVKLHGEDDCPKKVSCDPSWDYFGANTFETVWFWTFYLGAKNTTSALRTFAKIEAQRTIDTAFTERPNFTID